MDLLAGVYKQRAAGKYSQLSQKDDTFYDEDVYTRKAAASNKPRNLAQRVSDWVDDFDTPENGLVIRLINTTVWVVAMWAAGFYYTFPKLRFNIGCVAFLVVASGVWWARAIADVRSNDEYERR